MTSAQEAMGSPIASTLKQGVDWLSNSQKVTFRLYRRAVLPLDGFVFWVRDCRRAPVVVQGSLHYSTVTDQNETETAARNTVYFSTDTRVSDFDEIASDTLWIAERGGLKVAFSSRGRYYEAANLHHYSGLALLPAMRSQIIDDPASLNPEKAIVSNSLPAFLFLNGYCPPYDTPLKTCGLATLYPSFAIPDNLPPPYAGVHIERTENLQAAPWYDRCYNPLALASEDVRITAYGLNNDQAMILRDAVLQYSYDWNVIGIMDYSAVRDEKRPQPEFGILAQKKTMTFRVSYMQTAVLKIARQLIEKVVVDYQPQEV